MRQNQLGTSDLYVSEIGLGTMSLPEEEKTAIRLIDEAIDLGVNFIDTADLYRFGEIERVVGKAIKNKRDEVILATKGGNHWEEGKDSWFWDPSKAYIKEALKASLKRLGTDYIDLYQLHGGTIDDPIDETIEAFEELKQEGLICHWGISSIRPNVIRTYTKRSNINSVMMQYSMLDRRPEEEMLDYLRDNEISVIARGPVAKGMITERANEKTPDKGFLDYEKDEIIEVADQLASLSRADRSASQIGLKYTLDHPAVATVIPGASSREQLLENINAAKSPDLTDDELSAVRKWTKANTYQQHR